MSRSGSPPRLPPHARGMRIGLYGGSFNPPHHGHLLVARTALRRLGLDRLWWLVTPGNPLKSRADLPPQAERIAACRALVDDPRMVVSGVEGDIGTVYSQQTLAYLRRRMPGVRLVWVMGADSLAGFHRWQRWRAIATTLPMAVVERPGVTLKAVAGPAAKALGRFRLPESVAPQLAGRKPPAWVLLHGRRSPLSSTALRNARKFAEKS